MQIHANQQEKVQPCSGPTATLHWHSCCATMEKVTCLKYLGVLISSDLSWSAHIDQIASKARRTLGFIYYRNVNPSILTKLYLTIVRPMVEYSCAVWDPHLQKDIDKLESVQRLACEICTKNWSASYSDQLQILNLPSTHDCRTFLKLCTMYKILKNTFSFPENIIDLRSRFQTHSMSTRRVSANSLFIPYAHTNSYMNSFFLNTLVYGREIIVPEAVVVDSECPLRQCACTVIPPRPVNPSAGDLHP